MNVALGIEYTGTNYCGWQRQSHSASVQQNLEVVLSQVADQEIKVFCAGRTDTGVHATGQVVNFEHEKTRPLKAWLMGANTLLPDDICVVWAKTVGETFHARHSAIYRRYRYVIQNTMTRPANLNKRVTWVRNQLAVDKMHLSAQALLGENDFSSFQAASCQSATPYRCIDHIKVIRVNRFVVIDIQANAFLHHMVRNIAGALLEVGTGRQPLDYMGQVLALKDRTQAPMTAKPYGLYLVKVGYPGRFDIPEANMGPLTFADELSHQSGSDG